MGVSGAGLLVMGAACTQGCSYQPTELGLESNLFPERPSSAVQIHGSCCATPVTWVYLPAWQTACPFMRPVCKLPGLQRCSCLPECMGGCS